MSRTRIITLAVLGVVIVGVVATYWYQRPMLRTGTGYAAHNACAVDAIAGRSDAASDLPPNPLVPVLTVNAGDGQASVTLLGMFAKQTAWEVPGYGCTLASERPQGFPEPTAVDASLNPYVDAPLTAGDNPAVTQALTHAFGDDLDEEGRAELGTRAVVILKDGELVAERYAEGFGPSTPQLGWSMTKSVTNLLVGRMVSRGDIGLDDNRLRPEWTDARADITVRNLLQMTSGLEWDETYDLGTPITQMLYGEPDMGAFAAAQPLVHRPGDYVQYSSGSTTLLCDIVTDARGGADAPRRELFAPLGMASAVIEADASGTPVCSSYMWATPRDWATIGQLALADGVWNGERLLPTGWMEESTTAVDAEGEEGSDGYASGWWSNTRADGTVVNAELPADAYFASGHDGQKIVVVPSAGIVMVRLGFTPTADDTRVFSTAAQVLEALN